MATKEADQKETCLGQDQQEGTTSNKRNERQNSARSKTDKETVIWTLPRVPSGKLNESGREVYLRLSLIFQFFVFLFLYGLPKTVMCTEYPCTPK
jgi:hypothetical protein